MSTLRKFVVTTLALSLIVVSVIFGNTALSFYQYKTKPQEMTTTDICKQNQSVLKLLGVIDPNNAIQYLHAESLIWCSDQRLAGVTIHVELAERGFPPSMFQLYGILKNSPNIVDTKEMGYWLAKAAEAGLPSAIEEQNYQRFIKGSRPNI
jgi:hypothetical protein